MKRCIHIKRYTEGWRDGSVGHKDLHSNLKCVLVTTYWGDGIGRAQKLAGQPAACLKWKADHWETLCQGNKLENGRGRIHQAFSAPWIFTHTHMHAPCTNTTHTHNLKNLCIYNGHMFLNSEEEIESNPKKTHLLGKQDVAQACNRTEASGYTE